DLEVEISRTIGGAEGENGSFTVSSAKILNITRMLPEDATISFKRDGDNMVVSSARSRY
ncbi:MAG: DNA polymerase III subunit beta, partial [candidate division Zixibacteria bacterium]|nr:DNA polymerase III subunit beta [Gammaproteobacteria bacterium]NIT52637.1 DNA polymerase III subunit beta [candidate division Zixibacteria bacterium]NIW46887.1 DNA polymerase III subunit beta [Gammaproteobacteria bacterium]NIX57924.1 DNA polymerase III subunit beta [candidate division Zixibacteria bacterium]